MKELYSITFTLESEKFIFQNLEKGSNVIGEPKKNNEEAVLKDKINKINTNTELIKNNEIKNEIKERNEQVLEETIKLEEGVRKNIFNSFNLYLKEKNTLVDLQVNNNYKSNTFTKKIGVSINAGDNFTLSSSLNGKIKKEKDYLNYDYEANAGIDFKNKVIKMGVGVEKNRDNTKINGYAQGSLFREKSLSIGGSFEINENSDTQWKVFLEQEVKRNIYLNVGYTQGRGANVGMVFKI